jgi:hypothetical protein
MVLEHFEACYMKKVVLNVKHVVITVAKCKQDSTLNSIQNAKSL